MKSSPPLFPRHVCCKLDTHSSLRLSAWLGLSQPWTKEGFVGHKNIFSLEKCYSVYLQFVSSNFPFKDLNWCVKKYPFWHRYLCYHKNFLHVHALRRSWVQCHLLARLCEAYKSKILLNFSQRSGATKSQVNWRLSCTKFKSLFESSILKYFINDKGFQPLKRDWRLWFTL